MLHYIIQCYVIVTHNNIVVYNTYLTLNIAYYSLIGDTIRMILFRLTIRTSIITININTICTWYIISYHDKTYHSLS